MTKFTQGVALTQHVEAGGIRFAHRRLGVSEWLPLVFFQHVMGTLDDHAPALSDPALSVRHACVLITFGPTAPASRTARLTYAGLGPKYVI